MRQFTREDIHDLLESVNVEITYEDHTCIEADGGAYSEDILFTFNEDGILTSIFG